MLQRIQTLYLFIAAVSAILIFFLPYWQSVYDGNSILYTAGSITRLDSDQVILKILPFDNLFLSLFSVITLLNVITPLLIIFLYKNRVRQSFYTGFLILFQLISPTSGYWVVYQIENELYINGALEVLTSAQTGVVLPVLGLFCAWMARKSILKDEALVKSMNRIR